MKKPEEILDGLNDAQTEAVVATDGPVLILAGAGSGKTRCLAHRIAYLMSKGLAEREQILAVSFTNKAAEELGRRVLELLDYEIPENGNIQIFLRRKLPWLGTFHSICVRILRAEHERAGLSANFTIFDSDDSLALVRQRLKAENLDVKQYSPQSVRAMISSAKNEMIKPPEYTKLAQGHFQEIVARIYKKYQEELVKHGAVDFDDLILHTVDLLNDNPDICKKYQEKYKYIQIDEYQDTNLTQLKLTLLLTNPQIQNICVVGDDFQSIYAWRGANFRNILEFNKHFPTAQVFKLEQNYRSTENIINAAQAIIDKVSKKSDKKLWTENGTGLPVTVYSAADSYEEAEFIADEIRALSALGNGWNKHALLYRTNAQSRLYEEIFLQKGVPYRLIGAMRFYERKEVKDLLAYIRYILNPGDLLSFTRAVNTPPRGIGPVTIIKGGPKIDSFNEEIKKVDSIQPPQVLVEDIIKRFRYKEYTLDGTPEGEARWENVEELINLASQFENVNEFLEHVSLVSDVDNYDSDAQAVTLMTLHSAKGLEFETVFLVGMEEGSLPHMRALQELSELDEERRLCYVGMTRARKRLYLTTASQRVIHGMTTYTMPSRFIDEIDPKILDRL